MVVSTSMLRALAVAGIASCMLAACGNSSLNPFAEEEPPLEEEQGPLNIGTPETVIVPPSLGEGGAVPPPLGSNIRAFSNFLATRPVPAEFRQVFPNIQLVLPSDIVTADYRVDYRRFFAYLDALGRIEGGEFR